MTTDKVLHGKDIFLRQIELSDCTEKYVDWLNDPEVNQYLETKWAVQDMESIRRFVQEQRENQHSYLLAIVRASSYEHIGNIKIGPIHPHYHHADISYFIGEKQYWGRGYTTEAIRLICEFGFRELGLNRIEAGAYELAAGSWRALEKNGFRREGVFRKSIFFQGRYIDGFWYGKLRDEMKQVDH